MLHVPGSDRLGAMLWLVLDRLAARGPCPRARTPRRYLRPTPAYIATSGVTDSARQAEQDTTPGSRSSRPSK